MDGESWRDVLAELLRDEAAYARLLRMPVGTLLDEYEDEDDFLVSDLARMRGWNTLDGAVRDLLGPAGHAGWVEEVGPWLAEVIDSLVSVGPRVRHVVPRPPGDPAEVLAWAASVGVADLLDRPLLEICPSVGRLLPRAERRGPAGQEPTRAAFEPPQVGRRWRHLAEARYHVERVLYATAKVRAQERLVREALDAAATAPPPEPVARLLRALGALARGLPPSSPGAGYLVHAVELRGPPPELVVALVPASPDQWLGQELVVAIDRAHGDAPRIVEHTHVSAMRTALEGLMAEIVLQPRLQAALREELGTPAWQRLSDALAQVAPEAANIERKPEDRLCFRLVPGRNGEMLLGVHRQKLGARGWTKGQRLRSVSETDRGLGALTDRERVTVRLLRAAHSSYRNTDTALMADALRMLRGSSRLFGPRSSVPLTVREGDVTLRAVDEEGMVRLAVALGSRELDPGELATRARLDRVMVVIDLDEDQAVCTLADVAPAQIPVLHALHVHPARFPSEHRDALVRALPPLATAFRLDLPEDLSGRRVEPDRRLVLRLLLSAEGSLEVEALVRPLPEGPATVPGQGPPTALAVVDGALVHAVRAEGEVGRARAACDEIGLTADDEQAPFRWTIGELDRTLDSDRTSGRGPRAFRGRVGE